MGDSQQGNDKGMGRVLKKYKEWTVEETNELLKLMVDAANQRKILHALNDKLRCKKIYSQYLSRLKWFKQRYNSYSKLMRHSFRFGWDPVIKKFTTSDESHTTHKNYRTDTTPDYKDLRIAIGNGTAVGKHSIGLGDDTDARTFGVEENTGGFIQSDQQEPLYQPPSPDNSTSPLPSQPMRSETNNTQSDAIEKLTETIKELTHVIGSFTTREHSCWDVIKETPKLDNRARFKALGLLNTRAKKIEFLNMTPEERSEWLFYALME
ncbi:hypothetical protein ACOSQ4_009466 [Xanthoceras sorbifolium]